MVKRDRWQWLFAGDVPLLYPERNVVRQLQVETWLDLSFVVEALKVEKKGEGLKNVFHREPTPCYIV
jgi:hypothetical protein